MTTDLRAAAIRRLASEAVMGNEMIAQGKTSKADHMVAWEQAAKVEDNFAAAYNAARDMGSSVIVNSRCAALRIVAANWKGTRMLGQRLPPMLCTLRRGYRGGARAALQGRPL